MIVIVIIELWDFYLPSGVCFSASLNLCCGNNEVSDDAFVDILQ
jgi:hypothetical protein